MKSFLLLTVGVLLFGATVLPTQAAFSSLYVFGDGLSTTTDNPDTGPLYYGQRYSNGRVWVEVLAQRQGLVYNAANNDSYWDHNSALTLTDVKNFTAPTNVANDLFIVWVCNADTYDATSALDNSSQWQAAISQSQSNHWQIITNLYAKGVRNLILPNAVDISEIPEFNTGSRGAILHAGCVAYNVAFSNTIAQARVSRPGLNICALDFFTLLNNVLTNAANYGLTNALADGLSIDAVDASYVNPAFPQAATNGYGTNFIFWDPEDPTAKFHEIIADITQQAISPVRISAIAMFKGSNRLDVLNYPAGLNGFVDGCTNLVQKNWTAVVNLAGTNTTQSVFCPVSVPLQFYRLRFPYAWSYP